MNNKTNYMQIHIEIKRIFNIIFYNIINNFANGLNNEALYLR